jgi:hypothetical protein
MLTEMTACSKPEIGSETVLSGTFCPISLQVAAWPSPAARRPHPGRRAWPSPLADAAQALGSTPA